LAVQTFATQRALEVQRRREEYLAFVAHDLRNPLNAISLAARVLQPKFSGQGDSPKTAQMMKTLHRNVQRLQLLVEQILKESDHIQTETGVKTRHVSWSLVAVEGVEQSAVQHRLKHAPQTLQLERVSRSELILDPTVVGLLSGDRQCRLSHVVARNL